MKKFYLLLTAFVGTALLCVQAQVGAYTFTASSGTYNYLSGGTYVNLLSNDAGVSGPIPIGFEFVFNGVAYTQAVAVSDGYLSFNPSATSTPINNLASSDGTVRPLLAPLWDDLRGNSFNAMYPPRFSYLTTGTAGNHLFTAEWKYWSWNLYAPSNISFQIKLYEGTNKIEFIYRSESSVAYNGSASIGIAGSGTRSGNFLSLSNAGVAPVASSSTETTSIADMPVTGQTYTFTPPAAPATDLNITNLTIGTGKCPDPGATISAIIRNAGTSTIDFSATNAVITVNVSGAATQSLSATLNSGSLPSGASQLVPFSPVVNVSTNGMYTFKSLVNVTGDGNTSNDTATTALNLTYTKMPWAEPFATNTLPAGWNNTGWFIGSFSYANVYGNPGNCVYKSFSGDTAVGNFSTLPVGPVTANQQLTFDYKVSNEYSPYGTPGAGWGHFKVQISTNCGSTFTTIDSVTATSSGWITKSYLLSAFKGQYVMVKIVPKWATGSFYIAMDNFSIVGIPTVDLTTISTSLTGAFCPNNSLPVTVTIKNNGINPLDFAATNATVVVNATGTNNQVLSTTLNTGILAAGATQTVPVSSNGNFATAATYTVKSAVSIADDENRINDTLTTTASVATITTAPWSEPFLATTLPAGWRNTGWYVSEIRPGNLTGNPGNFIYKDFWGDTAVGTFTTLTIGPVAANQQLRFDYILSNSSSPYGPPATGWGHFKVQISTDCGGSFTTLDSVTVAPSGWLTKSYSLATYVGQSITVRIAPKRTAGSFNIAMDNFFVGTISPIDLAVVNVLPTGSICGSSSVPTAVTIKNTGSSAIDFAVRNASVAVQTSGPVIQTLSAALTGGALASGDTLVVAVAPAANLATQGTYTFRSKVAIADDGNAANDSLITTTIVAASATLPWAEPFATTATPAGWTTNSWIIGLARGATGNPGFNIFNNLYSSNTAGSFRTAKIGPIRATDKLSLGYKLSNYSSPYATPVAGWGYFKIKISNNCGSSFSTIDSIYAAGGGWLNKTYSLSAFAGQNITIGINAVWRSGDYDLAFDNFKISDTLVESCPTPVIRNADSLTTNTSATVYFNGTGNSFIAEYGPVGFTPGARDTAGMNGSIRGTTSSPVSITGLTPNTWYHVYIRQRCTTSGVEFSNNSIVDSFKTKNQLTNDLPNSALVIAVGAACNGAAYTNVGATKGSTEPGATCSGTQTTGKSVWFKFVAPASGFVKISTDITGNTLADTKVALYAVGDSSNYNTFQIIGCDDDNGVTNDNASTLYATGLMPQRYYYIVVDDFDGAATGNFCLRVEEATAAMIASSGSCSQGQKVPEFRPAYKGWASLTNKQGQLIANIRCNATTLPALYYLPYVTVNTGAVRQSATNEYYLDRNYKIGDTLKGNYDVQFFFKNTELTTLRSVAPLAYLSGLNVTRTKDTFACNPAFVSGSTADTLLQQTSADSSRDVSWVVVNTNGTSNFYLHPGTRQLSKLYTFMGSGAWSNPANWSNNEVPPTQLPPNSSIEIKPAVGGQCIMDVPQRIPAGSSFRVKAGTNVVIPGSVIVQ